MSAKRDRCTLTIPSPRLFNELLKEAAVRKPKE